MPMSVNLTAHGIPEVKRAIEEMGGRAVHAKPAMVKITAILLAGEQLTWQRRGKTWARADGTKAGVLTGALLRSLTEPFADGAVREIDDDHLLFGTSLFYARFMQHGTVHEPKRTILKLRPANRTAARDIIRKHILGGLGS